MNLFEIDMFGNEILMLRNFLSSIYSSKFALFELPKLGEPMEFVGSFYSTQKSKNYLATK